MPGTNAIAGEYSGKDQVLDYVRRRRALLKVTLEVNVEDVRANDENRLVIARRYLWAQKLDSLWITT